MDAVQIVEIKGAFVGCMGMATVPAKEGHVTAIPLLKLIFFTFSSSGRGLVSGRAATADNLFEV